MIHQITKYIAYLFLKIFFSLRVEGAKNIPINGAFIIASNHASYLDPIVAGASCKRKINFMGKEELFKNKLFGWYLRRLNVFPLKRFSSDSRALREAIKRLRKGGGLLIFPEGTRSNDGNIKEGKIGVSVLSYITKTPVIPCYVDGSYDIWPAGSHFFCKGRLRVYFAKPLQLSAIGENTKKTEYYEFAQKIMSCIKGLKEKAIND